MNIKKFLIVTCFTLQLTGFLHASQAAYNAAFQTFAANTKINPDYNSSYTLAQCAKFVSGNAGSDAISWSTASKIAKASPLNSSPQAMAVALYLSTGNPSTIINHFTNPDVIQSGSSVSFSNLMAALAAAQSTATQTTTQTTTTPVAAPVEVVTPAPTPIVSTPAPVIDNNPVTPTKDNSTQSATDLAAAALKTEIDASVATYNSYLMSINASQIKIAAA